MLHIMIMYSFPSNCSCHIILLVLLGRELLTLVFLPMLNQDNLFSYPTFAFSGCFFQHICLHSIFHSKIYLKLASINSLSAVPYSHLRSSQIYFQVPSCTMHYPHILTGNLILHPDKCHHGASFFVTCGDSVLLCYN